MILAGVLKESESGVAALDGVTEVIYELTKEKANRAEPPSFRDINLGRKDEDKDKEIINSTHQTDVAVRGNMPQVPRSPPQKSGSGVSGTPPVSTLPRRAQVTRASTAASASTEAFSLLLVDDNVSDPSRVLYVNLPDNAIRLLICASSKSSPRKAGTPIAQHRTVRKLWTSTNKLPDKNGQETTILVQSSRSSRRLCCWISICLLWTASKPPGRYVALRSRADALEP